MTSRALIPLATVLLVAAGVTAQDEQTGEQIVRRADRENRSRDERGVVEMVVVDEDGQRQVRSMEILGKTGEGDDDLSLVRFLAPPTIRGTALLTVEATGRADDQWVYLPGFRKTKRIASSDKTGRFAGTDFTYEDLRSENFATWTYKKLADGKVGNTDVFVVEATPKKAEDSGYSRRVLSIDKARFLFVKVEFYDKQNRHHKTLENRDWEQVQGLWRAKRARMQDHQRRTETLWQFSERQINPGLPDSTFTEATLERGL